MVIDNGDIVFKEKQQLNIYYLATLLSPFRVRFGLLESQVTTAEPGGKRQTNCMVRYFSLGAWHASPGFLK